MKYILGILVSIIFIVWFGVLFSNSLLLQDQIDKCFECHSAFKKTNFLPLAIRQCFDCHKPKDTMTRNIETNLKTI